MNQASVESVNLEYARTLKTLKKCYEKIKKDAMKRYYFAVESDSGS